MRGLPLPRPDPSGDKNERGSVLVVGGATEMPGAVVLAATAVLRAGAGKLQIATGRSIAPLVAVAVPEARVFGLAETETGAIAPSAAARIAEQAGRVEAVVIGPGMIDENATAALMRDLLPLLRSATLVLDALALETLTQDPHSLQHLNSNVILTPHAGEMATLLGTDKDAVAADARGAAERAAALLNAVVALKGAETFTAAPAGSAGEPTYKNRTGNIGLATSGSGDTLAGLIAGLAARGAPPLHAAVWGVYLHGCAGDKLARRMGRLGFLARELLAEVPALMAELEKPPKRKR